MCIYAIKSNISFNAVNSGGASATCQFWSWVYVWRRSSVDGKMEGTVMSAVRGEGPDFLPEARRRKESLLEEMFKWSIRILKSRETEG